ncbi:MAG: hypothetical protein DME23_12500 [Verrucomicrobia bacterium]|nr:MAG: hypothetical protein DME23_12500 [Verrucomicrobiota bacterium]
MDSRGWAVHEENRKRRYHLSSRRWPRKGCKGTKDETVHLTTTDWRREFDEGTCRFVGQA